MRDRQTVKSVVREVEEVPSNEVEELDESNPNILTDIRRAADEAKSAVQHIIH